MVYSRCNSTYVWRDRLICLLSPCTIIGAPLEICMMSCIYKINSYNIFSDSEPKIRLQQNLKLDLQVYRLSFPWSSVIRVMREWGVACQWWFRHGWRPLPTRPCGLSHTLEALFHSPSRMEVSSVLCTRKVETMAPKRPHPGSLRWQWRTTTSWPRPSLCLYPPPAQHPSPAPPSHQLWYPPRGLSWLLRCRR